MPADRAGRVVDRVLGIFLVPMVLCVLLLVSALSFYVVSRTWPCDWPKHRAVVGFNPDCPFTESFTESAD